MIDVADATGTGGTEVLLKAALFGAFRVPSNILELVACGSMSVSNVGVVLSTNVKPPVESKASTVLLTDSIRVLMTRSIVAIEVEAEDSIEGGAVKLVGSLTKNDDPAVLVTELAMSIPEAITPLLGGF